MSKILVLKGPPAAGKSTFARDFVSKNSHWIIVCRDSIRDSLGEYWVPERENLVSKIERDNIISAIEMGWNVIIDATNLNPKTIAKWEALADEYKCELEYKEFWIPFHEAIERDQNADRKHKIGFKVIKGFYDRYKPDLIDCKNWDCRFTVQRNLLKEKAIICDLDGTLCLHQGRSPFDYEKCNTDIPEERLLQLLIDISDSYKIIFLTGREKVENCEVKTREWLDKYFGKDYLLFMREKGDHRHGPEVKEELYHEYIEDYYDVITVFDDSDKCVDMWRNNLGLLCCQPYYGDF